jgi:D-arabinose 1-dehydrogenase-like Zn-dependent alcohol dehydrogenase
VEAGSNCVVFGLGGIGLNVIQGLRLAGAGMIIGVDINNAKKQWGKRFGMTHFVNPKEVLEKRSPLQEALTITGLSERVTIARLDVTERTSMRGAVEELVSRPNNRLATSRRKIRWPWPDLRIGLLAENCKVGRPALDLRGSD